VALTCVVGCVDSVWMATTSLVVVTVVELVGRWEVVVCPRLADDPVRDRGVGGQATAAQSVGPARARLPDRCRVRKRSDVSTLRPCLAPCLASLSVGVRKTESSKRIYILLQSGV